MSVFFDLENFAAALLSRTPSIGLVTWDNVRALDSVVHRLGPAMRITSSDCTIRPLIGSGIDGNEFVQKFLQIVSRKDANKTCLLIHHIEELVVAAARVLNGNRERLGSLRTCVVALRNNRFRDFAVEAPDLLDWIGLMNARAEDMGPPFTVREVKASVAGYENHYNLTSKAFLERWRRGETEDIPDAWLWKESLKLCEETVAEEDR